MAGEEPDQRRVRQRLAAARTGPADQEHELTGRLQRPFVQDVAADGVQGAGLEEVHDPFLAGLLADAARVVVAFSDRDTSMAVGDVLEMQAQHLAGAQTAVEHEQHHGQVPQPGEAVDQRRQLGVAHRSRQAGREAYSHRAPDRDLAAGAAGEGLMAARHPGQGVVSLALHRVLPVELLRRDRPLVEARHCSQHPRHRGRGQEPAAGGGDGQPQPLRRSAAGSTPEPSEQFQGDGGAELLPVELSLGQELEEMLQVIGVGDRRVGAVAGVEQMPAEPLHGFDGASVGVEQPNRLDRRTLLIDLDPHTSIQPAGCDRNPCLVGALRRPCVHITENSASTAACSRVRS